MAAQKTTNINLLPQEEFAASTAGRVLHWLLSTFRYLVITTEMIVIVAFLSRFYFDSRSADLNDEITQKQEFIEAYAQFEKDFRDTQMKLGVFADITNESNLVSPHVESVVATMPQSIYLTNVSVSPRNKIVIQGTSLSERDIAQYVVNLRSIPEFTAVSLDKMESLSGSNNVNFVISINMTNT